MEYRRIPQHADPVAELIIALVLMFLSHGGGGSSSIRGCRTSGFQSVFNESHPCYEADQSLANTPWQPDLRRTEWKPRAPSMRVLASADVHGRRQVYDWLIATAWSIASTLSFSAEICLAAQTGLLHRRMPSSTTLTSSRVPGRCRAADSIHHGERRPRRTELGFWSAFNRFTAAEFVRVYNFVGYQYSLPFMGGTSEKPEERYQG